MRSKFLQIAFTAVLFVAASVATFAQANPAATGPYGHPFSVGAGFSWDMMDYGPSSHMGGIVAWGNWSPFKGSRWLNRVALEAEVHDVNFFHPSALPTLRQDTALGGLNVSLWKRRQFRLYGKALGGLGSMDFPADTIPGHAHKTEGIYAFGGGIEYGVTEHFVVRGDYEEQVWPDMFNRGTALTPSAITVGVAYKFGTIHREMPAFTK